MNRQETIEYSPWLLNGTLSAAERSDILQQLKASAESRDDLADTLFVASLFAHRPATETMVALAYDGPLDEFERAQAEMHVELDPETAAELEMVRMSRRLMEENIAVAAPATASRPGVAAWWRHGAVAAALAAVLGAGLWLQQGARLDSLQDDLATAQQQIDGLRAASAAERSAVVDVRSILADQGVERATGGDAAARVEAQFEPGELLSIEIRSSFDADGELCRRCYVELIDQDDRLRLATEFDADPVGNDYYLRLDSLVLGEFDGVVTVYQSADKQVVQDTFSLQLEQIAAAPG